PSVHEAGTMRMEFAQLVAGGDLEIEAPPGEESAALLVSGRLEGPSGSVARSSPFDPPLAGWFLPAGTALTAHAELPTTLAIVTTKGAELSESGGEPVLLERSDGEVRGRDEWERTVVTLVDPSSCGSRRLIA